MTAQEKDAADLRLLGERGFSPDDIAVLLNEGWPVSQIVEQTDSFLENGLTTEKLCRDTFSEAYPRLLEDSSRREKNVFEAFDFYSVGQLTEEERRPPEFIVDGLIPCGLTFLSGAPKIRKSFLALQIAIAVARGEPFFGMNTKQCEVAYFDLEGSKSRTSARTGRLTEDVPEGVHITHRVPEKLADGLTDMLRVLHREHPAIRLLILDTYSRARGNVKSFGANAYDADVHFLEPIQRMALEENIAILFVHHDKKGAGAASDSFERLSGTMGISGSADCVINLIAEGKRFEGRCRLEYAPRDAKGGEMQLVFDEYHMEWQQDLAPATDILGNPVTKWIIDHAPEPKTGGEFFAYEDIIKCAYHMYMENPGTKAIEQIKPYREELFKDYNIAVQIGARSNGKRGIRIMSMA